MMIRSPKLTTLFIALLSAIAGFGQYYSNSDKPFLFEAGIGLGGMNCATDLGGPRGRGGYYLNEINWQNTELSGSIYASMLYKHVVGVRLEYTAGAVRAYDTILKGIATEKAIGRYERNLSFRSSIRELAILGEFHPLMMGQFEDKMPVFSPYLLAGVGVFAFDPKASLNGNWVRLHPLRTEGQGFPEYPDRKPYRLTQTNLSFGGGVRIELRRFNMRLEALNRRLHTDYLDDVSTNYIDPYLFDRYLDPALVNSARALYNRSTVATGSTIKRGNAKNSDAYITVNIKVGFKLGMGEPEYGSRRTKSRIGCKRI
ncbi:hypothetical protein EXU57_20655 [Segetibacter sp. 3557_3]|uniref:hypothetical protein n=1 Tax=Segetibacter sp. 3557_3 TaxID=2547429 RepID=UPI001058DD05|nr:hypothetical protein [Segetibacter sp. 3557_3]TDH20809.1 hypothetical protein EXU57_20655 [Segetibacter sp. 3557_3]